MRSRTKSKSGGHKAKGLLLSGGCTNAGTQSSKPESTNIISLDIENKGIPIALSEEDLLIFGPNPIKDSYDAQLANALADGVDRMIMEFSVPIFDPEHDGMIRRDYSRGKWTTREGDVLEIKSMDTSHIINCIRMLERTDNKKRSKFAKINEFEKELFTRQTGLSPSEFFKLRKEDQLKTMYGSKLQELKTELAGRKEPILMQTNEVRLTDQTVFDFAKDMGVRIPKKGARMYAEWNGEKHAVDSVTVEFTTQKLLAQTQKRSKKRGKKRSAKR